MAVHRKTEKQFLLKDLLFNEAKVSRLAKEIKAAYPRFDALGFRKKVVLAFPKQELMERIVGIRDALYEYLPADYGEAVKVIRAALPPPLDPDKTDNDFGEFIYAPYSYYVAEYGCEKKYLTVSLMALEEITKRFSCEAALRSFLNTFPRETLAAAARWAKSKNYHVRRLASEGTRPNLPWAKKITYDAVAMMPVLNQLHADKTRYVTRSVANHLNDVSKFAPDLVLEALARWKEEGIQSDAELLFITKHALRTLIKQGHKDAQALLGFAAPHVEVHLQVEHKTVPVGKVQSFSVTISNTSLKPQPLLVHYAIHFKKANGALSPKVFLLGKPVLTPGETRTFLKTHRLAPMTTRVLYSGEHILEIKVNGQTKARATFLLS